MRAPMASMPRPSPESRRSAESYEKEDRYVPYAKRVFDRGSTTETPRTGIGHEGRLGVVLILLAFAEEIVAAWVGTGCPLVTTSTVANHPFEFSWKRIVHHKGSALHLIGRHGNPNPRPQLNHSSHAASGPGRPPSAPKKAPALTCSIPPDMILPCQC